MAILFFRLLSKKWSGRDGGVTPLYCYHAIRFFPFVMSQKSLLLSKWLLHKVKIKWETRFLIGTVLIVTRIWEFDCSTDNAATRWNC